MAKTALATVGLPVDRDPDTSATRVRARYEYTTSDDETMSKSRDITADLTQAQRDSATTWLAAVENRIKLAEGIA